jgi:hypothetical protein
VLGPEYWARVIHGLRNRLPQYVRDLLDAVESLSEDTCDYYPLIPELIHVARVSEMSRNDPMDDIRILIDTIKKAHNQNTLISKPLYKDHGRNVFRPMRGK